jgi:hypothetical protein
MSVYLPVSIGEALDKLTILDIKLSVNPDNQNIKLEYDLLKSELQEYITNNLVLYENLKKVNKEIWDYMDILRDLKNTSDQEYNRICRLTIELNDVRFRIKKKINNLTNSIIKEEKCYQVTCLEIIIKDEHDLNKITDFIDNKSLYYDLTNVICRDGEQDLRDYYKLDPTIVFNQNIQNKTQIYL